MKPLTTGRVTLLAGGVGAARLLRGLIRVVDPRNLTIVVNTADDDLFHGLHVSPDVDTILYTLAGLANPGTGWGIAGDTFRTMDALDRFGEETWFRLGDRDLATHLFRTQGLSRGQTLSQVTAQQAKALGVKARVLPMSDGRVRTIINTAQGRLSFQEYLVRDRARPTVQSIHYEGIRRTTPAPGVLSALQRADLIVFGPSNPFVSIGPILALPRVRAAVRRAAAPVIGVSPLIGGRPVKGPADRMMRALGMKPGPLPLADLYRDLLDGLVLDSTDRPFVAALQKRGLRVATTNTLMKTPARSTAVAREVVSLAESVRTALAS